MLSVRWFWARLLAQSQSFILNKSREAVSSEGAEDIPRVWKVSKSDFWALSDPVGS